MSKNPQKLEFRVLPDGKPQTASGRNAWTLSQLVTAGDFGCTPLDCPAPRWSAYIHNLRKDYGLAIETVTEPHGGPYSGTHARYVLRALVEFLKAE